MTVDFSAYLEAICNNPKYMQWWKTYTVTDVVGKEISNRRGERPFASKDNTMRSPFLLDLGLIVQTVPKKEERENRQEEKEKIERFDVLEGLRKYAANHVLLRGKPGSGKSTALVRLLLEDGDLARSQKAKGKSQKEDHLKIPVLVELRSYKTSVLDLIKNFTAQNQLFVNSDDLETLLKEGKLLLLVDGVNELPSDAAYRDLQQFEQQYPQTAMIFTTRELGLRGDLNIENKLTMEPLTEPQMQQFVKSYLPEKTAEAMLKQLGGRIKELGETPLLLWMLCSVFVQNQQEIPDNLGGVFRAFTSIYDEKLKADVKTQSNSRILWSDSLKYLAFEMTKRKDEPAISATEAESILEEFLAEAGETNYSWHRCRLWLQDLLDYHLLQRQGEDNIEFHHQLIQEYYTAETLVLEFDKITDEQLQWDYLNYLKWTEPMAVVAGLLGEEKQAVRLVKLGLAVDLQLGARLAGEVNDTFQGETVDLVKNLEIPALYKVELLERTKSEETISELEKALNDSDPSVRINATKALQNIGSDKAIDSLKKALNDSNWWVRRAATFSLGNMGSDRVIESLQKALNDSNEYVRSCAAQALGNIGSDKAIESLETALNHSDGRVRRDAALALGNIGSDKAIESLETALNDSIPLIGAYAAQALGNIGSDKAIESLETALNHSSEYIREKAAKALGDIGIEKAIDGIEKALNDSDEYVNGNGLEAWVNICSDQVIENLQKALNHSNEYIRENAAEALGKIGSDKAIESLKTALNHSSEYVRENAAEALGTIGSDKAIESLVGALNDFHYKVHSKAVEALGNIGSDKAIESLENALNHSNWKVRINAAEALGKIHPDKAIESLKMALNHSDEYVRENATFVLGTIGSDKAIESLETALKDSHWTVPRKAVEALGTIGSDKAIESLENALNHSDWKVRINAAEALGRIHPDKAIESLKMDLNHSNEYIRSCAVEALGNIGSDKAIESLENALNDSNEYIRSCAVSALGNIGSDKVIESLETALNHSDERVRRDAAFALIRIGSDKVIERLKTALNHSDNSVRQDAAFALGRIGSDNAIESLERALNDSHGEVSKHAAFALGRIGSDKAIESLETALNHSNTYVRWNAAFVLGEIGSDKAIKVLYSFLLNNSLLKGYWQDYNDSFYYILEALETIQDKCQIYQPLCLPFLKIPQNTLISDTKITEYCLKYRQHHDKSRQLTQAGFSLSNPQQLKEAIKQLITQNIVSRYQENDYGILYQVKGELNSINDEKLAMITVWLKRKIDQKIQFISLKII